MLPYRNPVALGLTAHLFATPFCAGMPLFIFASIGLLIAFIIYATVSSRGSAHLFHGTFRRQHPALHAVLLAFFAVSLVSLLRVVASETSALHKFAAAYQYLFYLLMAGFAISLGSFYRQQKISLHQLLLAYAAGCVVLAILLLTYYHLGLGNPPLYWSTRAPFGEGVRIMGLSTSIGTLACVVSLAFTRHSRPRQLALLATLLACSAFLVWTGSRASMFITLVFTLILLGWRLYLKKMQTRAVAMVLATMLLSVPVAESFSIFPWSGLGRAIKVSVIPADSQAPAAQNTTAVTDQLSSGRVTLWTRTLVAIEEKPWLGHGPASYYFHPMRFKDFIHTHNVFLQFLMEWGVIGSSLLLAFLGTALWYGIRRLPQAFAESDLDYVLAATVVLSLSLTSLIDGVFFMAVPLFTITTAFAIFPFQPAGTKASQGG